LAESVLSDLTGVKKCLVKGSVVPVDQQSVTSIVPVHQSPGTFQTDSCFWNMLCSSCSIVHIVSGEVQFGMPGCTSFVFLSAVQWAQTISGKYSRDVFHVYFLPY